MKYIDLHCDTVMELYERRLKKQRENACAKGGIGSSPCCEMENLIKNSLCIDMPKLKAGDALMQAFACFSDMKALGSYDASWDYVMHMIDMYEEMSFDAGIKPCRGSKDAEEMMQLVGSQTAGICADADIYGMLAVEKGSMNDIPAVKDADIYGMLTVEDGGLINGKEDRLDCLYDRGVRLITLTWNYENCLGYPNAPDPWEMRRGLKPFGKDIVEKMNELKMIVDVSHLSDGGFYDVADIMKRAGRQFVASHSCARALCAHPRNMTDDMLKTLGNAGGIVGVNYYGQFLNNDGRSDAASIVEHIKYMINKAGIESVALGSDFDGFLGGSEIENAAKMPLLFDTMRKSGLSFTEIEKVAWKNAASLFRNTLQLPWAD